MIKLLLLFFLFLPLVHLAQHTTPFKPEVEAVLKRSGTNRTELEKALNYFKKTGDPLKIKAIEFLIANMDIHYTANYYWADSTGKRLSYNELNYPDFATSVKAFEELKLKNPGIRPVPYLARDVDSIKADYLINNTEKAFAAWASRGNKKVAFKDFCEYILPYRVSVEPLQNWRDVYRQKFSWINDSIAKKGLEYTLSDITVDFKTWFTFILENTREPLPRLGSLQLLHRKNGPCQESASLEVFQFRSLGIPVAVNIVPEWATSTGRHFYNSVFDSDFSSYQFDVFQEKPEKKYQLPREPAKVIRTTFSKQPGVIATLERPQNIPEGFMRTLNYIDVTDQNWETAPVKAKLHPVSNKPNFAYACVYNGGKWRPVWWGKVNSDSVVFTNMCKGAVFMPAYYQNGKLLPAGHPVASGYRNQQVLAPDTLQKRTISIMEQDKYLIFQPGKKYKLYYWDREWKLCEEKIPDPQTLGMEFKGVPRNALFLLVPEYSKGKERPFIITNDGDRVWF